MSTHSWPGNVRELRNTLQRATLLRANPDRLDPDDIEFTPSTLLSRVQTGGAKENRTLAEIERDSILNELHRHRGVRADAASALGVSRSTIHRKIIEYGIDTEEFR